MSMGGPTYGSIRCNKYVSPGSAAPGIYGGGGDTGYVKHVIDSTVPLLVPDLMRRLQL